ncbi:hypothetical protein AJ80_06401 [Polytolypa hystricis UAMH7299]|uniref:N-acetyltransferase domain-containing protein n=1 Tax=Polytolypa hystricis (strain UAMH7299) TaxID=1447883 RepID=A0A2B7XWA2_POLH7|nr:hypothetical protein AJ80_06401 [Polytolypa hystricis UAMH7299]
MEPPSTPPPLPPLRTTLARTDAEKISALHLIADSIAQQRQTAARSLLSHPLLLSISIAFIAITTNLLLSYNTQYTAARKTGWGELAFVATTVAGCVMAMLLIVQWATGGYLVEAERVGTWAWLNAREEGGEEEEEEEEEEVEDEIFITTYGEEVIGALILRFLSTPSPPSKQARKGETSPVRRKGVIRAWTVKRRFRNKGVGTALLEEAVLRCREKCGGGEDETVATGPVFANNHANALRVLPKMLNGAFEKREVWAQATLERVIREVGEIESKHSQVS